jgi:hypothetical protein
MPGMRPDQSIADETTSKVSITPSGQVYADDGYIFRSGTINFPYITQAQRDSLRDMYAIVKDHTPVIMIIWPSNTAEETPIYALENQNNLKFTRTDDVNYRWATTLNFREVF